MHNESVNNDLTNDTAGAADENQTGAGGAMINERLKSSYKIVHRKELTQAFKKL